MKCIERGIYAHASSIEIIVNRNKLSQQIISKVIFRFFFKAKNDCIEIGSSFLLKAFEFLEVDKCKNSSIRDHVAVAIASSSVLRFVFADAARTRVTLGTRQRCGNK